MCGGVKTPPYKPGQTGNEPGTPRGSDPCREAYMPPLQTPGIAYTNPKTSPQGERPRAACMRPLQTGREQQVNG